MNADGTGLTKITKKDGDDYEPAWSPDGRKIVFQGWSSSGPGATVEVFVINVDGTGLIRLTQSNGWSLHPDWQPIILGPVGGVVSPVNKLTLVTPYLALAGLIAAVSAVVAVKKRRD
jgi:hypothetical protein